ncbi:Hypothetical predicted protein [Mytilus galloprovincialis]|uniref:Uncharacterized protein n=1 Tax=Mytilus galloprovincialis TaxID=29158 RepID=A0A8B6H4E2_MYTGA|nr:Hypothetical predicted protein [Mytilus galloprovincialis]
MADDTDTAAFVQSLKNDNTVRKTTSDMRLSKMVRSNKRDEVKRKKFCYGT